MRDAQAAGMLFSRERAKAGEDRLWAEDERLEAEVAEDDALAHGSGSSGEARDLE